MLVNHVTSLICLHSFSVAERIVSLPVAGSYLDALARAISHANCHPDRALAALPDRFKCLTQEQMICICFSCHGKVGSPREELRAQLQQGVRNWWSQYRIRRDSLGASNSCSLVCCL